VVCNQVRKHKVDLLCLQETKKQQIDLTMCQFLWGDSDVSWEIQPAINIAGGLLCLWSDKSFKVDRRVCDRDLYCWKESGTTKTRSSV